MITQYEGYGGAALRYGGNPGWRSIGQCAISDLRTGLLPPINYEDSTDFIILEAEFSDEELLEALRYADEESVPNNSRLWHLLDRLQPYLFIAYKEHDFFAAKNKAFIEVLHSPSTLAGVEEQEKAICKTARMSKWKSVGPECGPEKCTELGCERLRIERAVRCYMHQLAAFGG